MSAIKEPVIQRWKRKTRETAKAVKVDVAVQAMAAEEEKGMNLRRMDVCPQNLRFTQDSIAKNFKPPFENLRIDDAVHQIRIKFLSPAMFPPLNVVEHNGILWSLDNRRLWVFRKAGIDEIRVNLVSKNFSPRSSEFFTHLNADLEKIYSNPTYYPRVRGTLRKMYVKKIPTLPSLPTHSSQQKFTPNSSESDLLSTRNDAAKKAICYLPLPGFENKGEVSNHKKMSHPDRVKGTENTGAVNVSSSLKFSPEPKVIPSVSVVPNPKDHHQVIDIRNHHPYVPLPSSEKEGVSENVVIIFMKKLFHTLRLDTTKFCCGLISSCMPCLKGDEEFLRF